MLSLKLVEIIWFIYKQIIFSRYTAIKNTTWQMEYFSKNN